MTTAIVIDPAAPQGDGTLQPTTVGWVDAAHLSTLEVRILCHAGFARDSLDGLPVEKVFGSRDAARGQPRNAQRLARMAIRDALMRPLAASTAADILILADATLAALEGLATWACGVAAPARPRLIVWFARLPLHDGDGATALAAALARLRTLFGARLAVLAAGADLVTHLAALKLGEIRLLPAAALIRGAANADMVKLRRDVLAPLLTDEAAPAAPAVAGETALPGVDIIVPLHNYARFLRRCLASVAAQTYSHWRCVVVDDGSTDIPAEALRTLVASFGERFELALHGHCEGQAQAIATGLSLGAHPFVVVLDADDCLLPDALDLHLAWHLNAVIPAAFTCGGMNVVDVDDTLLAGALDNINHLTLAPRLRPFEVAAAWRRPGVDAALPAARFADRDDWTPGAWLWCAMSALMFRRSLMELVLPDDFNVGRYSGDTLFAFGCHLLGSSIRIEAPVARYTRHGGNGYSDTAIYGTATLASRPTGVDWSVIAAILHDHIRRNHARFLQLLPGQVVDRALAITAMSAQGRKPPRPADAPPPFVPRVIRRLRHEARRIRTLAQRLRG